jgi:hypothetical protein
VEWAKKAPRTREDWERAWQHLEPSISDIIPPTISLEDMSAIRADIEARISSREAHRVIKVWRALWKVTAFHEILRPGCRSLSRDPQQRTGAAAGPVGREGEVVRLAKGAWRMGFKGLAAVIATGWDTQLSPVDIRSLTAAQGVRDARGFAFLLERAKTGRAAAGTLSRRAEMIVDAYIAGLGVELLANATIFRNRSDPGTIAAKMANTLSTSNALHRAYIPVEITNVRAADGAGRTKIRKNKKR